MSARVLYFFPLLRSVFAKRRSNSAKALRGFTSLLLITVMLGWSVPPSVAGSLIRDAVTRSSELASSTRGRMRNWHGSLAQQQSSGLPQDGGTMPPRPVVPGVRPQTPQTKAEREARADSLVTNPRGTVTLQSREPMSFSAVPMDNQGTPIH